MSVSTRDVAVVAAGPIAATGSVAEQPVAIHGPFVASLTLRERRVLGEPLLPPRRAQLLAVTVRMPCSALREETPIARTRGGSSGESSGSTRGSVSL